MSTIEAVKEFWNQKPCGSDLSKQEDRRKYFEEVAVKRYMKEPHILPAADFGAFKGKSVLEIGCGLGTDGLQFAKQGASYTGVDLTPAAVDLTREHFKLMGCEGRFLNMNAEHLPLDDASFDHVYSFGVIHHSPNTEAIVREIARVLRPGGTFCVMVYNRSSINYHVEIRFLRKWFRLLLLPEQMPRAIAKLTGLPEDKLRRHRELFINKKYTTEQEWININTDGPDCPLAKLYNEREAAELFSGFSEVSQRVYFFDRSHWAVIGQWIPDGLAAALGRRWGWHRIIYGRKA